MGKVINRRTHYGILPCFVIQGKAVKLTKTDMDDKLLETVKAAIAAKE